MIPNDGDLVWENKENGAKLYIGSILMTSAENLKKYNINAIYTAGSMYVNYPEDLENYSIRIADHPK
jgi:hypothetical protein